MNHMGWEQVTAQKARKSNRAESIIFEVTNLEAILSLFMKLQ